MLLFQVTKKSKEIYVLEGLTSKALHFSTFEESKFVIVFVFDIYDF